MKVQYLIQLNANFSETSCTDITSFKEFISMGGKLKITESNKISYDGYTCDISIEKTNPEDCNKTILCINFVSTKNNDSESNKLSGVIDFFLQKIKDVEEKTICLWDDRSLKFNLKLYPLIFKVENMLRALIIKFMYINLGDNWETTHTQVTPKPEKKGKSDHVLYELDFIDLVSVLFKEKPIKDSQRLGKAIEEFMPGESITEEQINKLREFVPQNNWDRYFSEILDCKSDHFIQLLEELYQIRCKVAHNNMINKQTYHKGKGHCDKLIELLKKAEDKLSDIVITEEEKKQIEASISESSESISNRNINRSFVDTTIPYELTQLERSRFNSYLEEQKRVASLLNVDHNVTHALGNTNFDKLKYWAELYNSNSQHLQNFINNSDLKIAAKMLSESATYFPEYLTPDSSQKHSKKDKSKD